MRFFTYDFFTDGLLPRSFPFSRLFEFGFEFEMIFAFFYWLSVIIFSGESILPTDTVTYSGELTFWYFKYKELHENSTKFEIAFMHVYWDQDKPFSEKTGVKKSRWTVPLSIKKILYMKIALICHSSTSQMAEYIECIILKIGMLEYSMNLHE
jgi:hypothetical protein